jgi:AcrR family transcriptional regulator
VARTINPATHAVRREAFVDAAERLIQSKGYEQMSVQDVLDALDASRGAFYHYFDSKVALLEAVIERMVDQSTAALRPLVDDPDRAALEKLAGLFAGVARWKAAREELMIAVLQVWFSDENALVREKLRQRTVARLTPLLAAVVAQGRAEGVFTASAPDETARVLVSLWLGLNEVAGELFVAHQSGAVTLDAAERAIGAHFEAFERILGTPVGSLPIDRQTLERWFG